MPLSYIEHFLLQTEDIEATKDWYVKVLGFRVGPAPDFKFPVYWLYLGDRDVLHITTGGKNVSENRKKYVGQESDVVTGTGVIDHIGFRTTGLDEMICAPESAQHRFQGAPGRRPGALSAVPVRSERREDRAELPQLRGQRPQAAAHGERPDQPAELKRAIDLSTGAACSCFTSRLYGRGARAKFEGARERSVSEGKGPQPSPVDARVSMSGSKGRRCRLR